METIDQSARIFPLDFFLKTNQMPVANSCVPLANLGPSCSKRLDDIIHLANRYPVDKCKQIKPRYPQESALSGG